MANVPLTEKRINEILDKLLAHERRAADEARHEWLSGDFALEVYYAFHDPEEVRSIEKFTPDWVARATTLLINDQGPGPKYFHGDITFAVEMPIKYQYHATYLSESKFPPDLRTRWRARQAAYLDAETEFAEKRAKHVELFKRYKTVNALYKVWPSILEFCTPDMIEQFNKPIERRTKEEVAALADQLKDTIATARILRDVTK